VRPSGSAFGLGLTSAKGFAGLLSGIVRIETESD